MNTDQANKLPLPEIVESIGGKFSHEDSHGSRWYNSPLRLGDSDPSFHITQVPNYKLGQIWVWKDFGDEGGSVIDLIMRKYNVGVAGALRVLEEDLHFGKANLPLEPAPLLDLMGPPRPEAEQQPNRQEFQVPAQKKEQKKESANPVLDDVRIEALANRALKGYLYGRGIDFWIARPYVKEMHYTHDGRPFFALAFPNDLGDYELRNPYYQGVYGRKAITTLHPEKMQEGGVVVVFEGFMDFLSALAWYGMKEPRSTVIVLNSVEMKHEAARVIRELKASAVEAYPDNDDAGRKLIPYLQENLPGVYVEDKSSLYADYGYKDFNDLVKAEKSQEKRQAMAR